MRRIIRRMAGGPSNTAIVVTKGRRKPHLAGQPASYVTRTGKPIHFPNAYQKAGGAVCYVPSTLHIEVGDQWINRRMTAEDWANVMKETRQ